MDGSALADPLFWAVAVPALLLVGIAKGGFGGGVGLIGVPLIAIAVPLVEAAAIMRCAASTGGAMGFSTSTCLPWLRARVACSRCRWCGVQT